MAARSRELGVHPLLTFWECGLCHGYPHEPARMYLLERDGTRTRGQSRSALLERRPEATLRLSRHPTGRTGKAPSRRP
jgi:hypothetical protein